MKGMIAMKTVIIKYGLEDIPKDYEIITREGVKGVIILKNKVLMIKTNKGDYKFPGGGVEKNETYYDTLRREILEETGYQVETIEDTIVETTDIREDKYEENNIFQMKNIYIKCSIKEGFKGELKLDDYENKQEFYPEFVDIDNAINNNKKLLEDNCTDVNEWVKRDTDVLDVVKKMYFAKEKQV